MDGVFLPVVLVGLMATYAGLRGADGANGRFYFVGVAIALATVAVLIKLSAMPLLLFPMLALVLMVGKRVGQRRARWWQGLGHWLIPLLAFVVLVGSWVMRGVLLSGCVLYPAAVGCVPGLEWTTPPEVTAGLILAIQSWARSPGGDPAVVLADWRWVLDWVGPTLRSPTVWLVVGLITVGIGLRWYAGRARMVGSLGGGVVIALVGSVAGIIYWFLSAPDLRFGWTYLLALGVLVLVLGLVPFLGLKPRALAFVGRRRELALVVLVGLMCIGGTPRLIRYGVTLGWPILPVAATRPASMPNGAVVRVPVTGDQCWTAPLPCTPETEVRTGVEERRDGRGMPEYVIPRR